MLLRRALDAEAAAAADVVRRSITDLCRVEYRDDPRVLARWLVNKTAAEFRRWLASPDREVCLALEAGRIAAVGMVAWRGEILLNFVAPEARFRGASKALMAHMEAALRARGLDCVALFSTQLATGFYRSLGYDEVGRITSRFGTLDPVAMAKRLG